MSLWQKCKYRVSKHLNEPAAWFPSSCLIPPQPSIDAALVKHMVAGKAAQKLLSLMRHKRNRATCRSQHFSNGPPLLQVGLMLDP